MKLEEMEKMLEGRIEKIDIVKYSASTEALNSLSNAVQALLMVRQERDRQKALNQAVEPEKVIIPKGSGVQDWEIK